MFTASASGQSAANVSRIGSIETGVAWMRTMRGAAMAATSVRDGAAPPWRAVLRALRLKPCAASWFNPINDDLDPDHINQSGFSKLKSQPHGASLG